LNPAEEDGMAETVRVRSLSVFFGSAEDRQLFVGDEFEASAERAAELERNGLVEKAAKPAAFEPSKKASAPAKGA
jgi:hypothetical protein